jgi:AraC family transcriptional regulator
MGVMGSAQPITHFAEECEELSVRVTTDPPGRVETPGIPRPRVAIHLGQSVYMACERAGLKHRGRAVHGDIDVVPANTRCVWKPESPDTALILAIHPDLLARAVNELGLDVTRLEVANRFQVRDAQIEHISRALKAEMEAGYPTGRIFFESLSTALAVAVVQRHSSLAVFPFPSQQRMSGSRLRQAIAYIEDNLNRDLSLNNIAQAVDMSVSNLKATFRGSTGVPVHQYVIQRRVDRAASLLEQGTLTIGEVAHETGFTHQSHLARHLQRRLGCSPKALRPQLGTQKHVAAKVGEGRVAQMKKPGEKTNEE